jgi:cytoskeletal protein RodZ
MGQAERGLPEAPAVGRIGAYLARERQLRRISLDELSVATRVPRRSLERLEAGAFDEVRDGFSRGFVRAVALALGLPPDETVARMLPEVHAGARLPRRRPQLPGGRILLPVGVAALGLLLWWAFGRPLLPAPPPDEPPQLLYRRDAVRELAAETQ